MNKDEEKNEKYDSGSSTSSESQSKKQESRLEEPQEESKYRSGRPRRSTIHARIIHDRDSN